MGLAEVWEMVKTLATPQGLGLGGTTALCLLLWLDERRERRQIQRHVNTLHRENTKRLEKILRRVKGASGSPTAGSGKTNGRGTR